MSKNKRITAKEIKQGVTAWVVQVGIITPITFTSKVYYDHNRNVPGWKFKYVSGVGRSKPYEEFSTQPWDRYLADAGVTCPGNFRPTFAADYHPNAIFRTKKAAEKFVLDSKAALEDHDRRMEDWETLFSEDMYDEVFEDMCEGAEEGV